MLQEHEPNLVPKNAYDLALMATDDPEYASKVWERCVDRDMARKEKMMED